jgi:Leucine-rich repeat (LRR) protein
LWGGEYGVRVKLFFVNLISIGNVQSVSPRRTGWCWPPDLKPFPHIADTVAEFLLGGNPWLCDCEMEWMKDINRLSLTHSYGRIIDIESVMCTTSTATAIARANSNVSAAHHTPLLLLESEQFMCSYEAHCIPQCFCCDFFACDCRMQCPEGCSCYHDNAWANNVIQCSAGDFTDIPPLIPMDATTVYLDGNNMTELVNPGFIGRKRVHTIYLNNSLIQHVTNFSFEGLANLRVLHLENNLIERLEGTEFTGLDKLKELYLQNNMLVSVAADTFESLRSLAVLRLDGNLLTNFPVWELTKNPLLVSYKSPPFRGPSQSFMKKFFYHKKYFGEFL